MATPRKAARVKKAAKSGEAAGLIDGQLERYRSMRDFAVTAEPSGAAKQSGAKAHAKEGSISGLPFVIQKHAASHLHYDFRLGWNGVLKSWAVAKGPSYNVRDKRLAVQVEDHPIEYGGFEGIIPKGQYGGGTVMLWDTGTWEPQEGHTDVDAGLRDGSLKFVMHGTKMKGKWALIRMGGKAANEKKPNWLLIKEHDSFERGESDACITEESPDSVVTGRSLDEIAKESDHVWNSKAPAGSAAASVPAGPQKPGLAQPEPVQSESAQFEPSRTGRTKSGLAKASLAKASLPKSDLPKRGAEQPSAKRKAATAVHPIPSKALPLLRSCPKEALPAFIAPQLASRADAPPSQEGWLHELKLDGYRVMARKSDGKVELLTRTGLDWTHRMKPIVEAVASLAAKDAIFDGEVVVLAADGTTSFANLQASFKDGANHPLTYFIFDLLHLDGHNLRGLELVQRKQILASLLSEATSEFLRLSEDIDSDGPEVFQHACDLHAEGIISKRASAPYTSGRSSTWLKAKCAHEQEFVIGGFTLPANGIHGVGALLLGYYAPDGKLIYAGRTGTGFTQKTHRLLRTELEKLRLKSSPFASVTGANRLGAIWVKPSLVAQVGFATWTADNLLRQAAFKGLREDKPAGEVRLEEPLPVPGKSSAKATHATRDAVAAKVLAAETQSAKPAKSSAEHAKIRLTHPDKIIDAESNFTKQQLADYYWQIADYMLPQIANRPLSIVRCPEGSTKPCFFQKHTNATLPAGVESIQVPDKKTGKLEPYITIGTREALAGLAQMGVLEVHPWGSHNDDLEHPDRIIIDLDPDESIAWSTLAVAAKETRTLLKSIGLVSFLKSTGGKGLHLVVPIVPEHDWTAIKQVAHTIALELQRQSPELYLTKMSKAARKGRIYIDYLRNERGATAVAAFSTRSRARLPVSIPLSWSELDADTLPIFYAANFEQWKDRLKRDPWKALSKTVQRIDLGIAALK